MKNEMQFSLAIALCVVCFALAGSASINSEAIDASSPNCERIEERIRLPLISFYGERAASVFEASSELLGCGVLLHKTLDGNKRFFIATAAHVLRPVFQSKNEEFCNYRIGVNVGDNSTVRTIPLSHKDELYWLLSPSNDLAVAEVTQKISEWEQSGANISAINLDTPWISTSRIEGTIHNVGILLPRHMKRLGIGATSRFIAIGAVSTNLHALSTDGYLWSYPYEWRDGELSAISRKISIYYADSSEYDALETIVSEFTMDAFFGMSGGITYAIAHDGNPYVYGINIGMSEGRDRLHVIFIGNAIELIAQLAGDNITGETSKIRIRQ